MFVTNSCKYDTRVLKEAATLTSAGYDVRIIATLDEETECYEEKDGFRIIRVPNAPGLRRLLKKTLIIRPFVSLLYRSLALLDYCRCSWKVVKGEPADIYHSHDFTGLPIGYYAKRKLGGKLVYDSHELFTEIFGLGFFTKRILRLIEKFLIHRADEVITVNNSIAMELSKRYKIELPHVIMNCPPKSQPSKQGAAASLRKRLGLNKETPVVLYHGGFAPGRGLENLILSAKYLNKGKIVMMGQGKIEQVLKDLANKIQLGDKVLFAEPVLPHEVAGQVAEASIGVSLTRNVCLNNFFSTPNKFFDYLIAGIPVVTSDFPELKRITEEHNLGKTCNPEEPRDIAAAINWVLGDKQRYQQLRANATKAAKLFNWEIEAKKLLEIYHRLAKG